MTARWFILFGVRVAGILAACAANAGDPAPGRDGDALARSWAQWRGPRADGSAPQANPPTSWSEGKNVRWRVGVPGKGHASPIVYGDHVYVLTAVPVGSAQKPVYDKAPGTHDNVPVTHQHEFTLMAFRRSDGRIAWQRNLKSDFPHEGGHETGSLASHSPATDGERVYAFLGSRGLHVLGTDGGPKWSKDLGRMDTHHAHGEGSSPVVFGESLYVNWDHEGRSYLYCFDKRSGSERWKTERDEKTSWSTPLIVGHAGRHQVIVSATKKVRAYDTENGNPIWECAGLTDNVVSSPVAWDGVVIAGNSYYRQAMLAVRLEGARGDVSSTDRVAWRSNRLTPYVSSPLMYQGTLYYLRHLQNILSRVDPLTGKPRAEPLRLEGIQDFIFASPVAAAGRIYVTGRDGVTVVLRADGDNETVSVNRLEDSFSASAALVDREIYLRGERFLYCLAESSN